MVLLNPLSKYGTFGLNLNFPKENHSSEFGKGKRLTQVDSSQYSEFISHGAFEGFSSRPRNVWQGNPWAYSALLLPVACKGKTEKPSPQKSAKHDASILLLPDDGETPMSLENIADLVIQALVPQSDGGKLITEKERRAIDGMKSDFYYDVDPVIVAFNSGDGFLSLFNYFRLSTESWFYTLLLAKIHRRLDLRPKTRLFPDEVKARLKTIFDCKEFPEDKPPHTKSLIEAIDYKKSNEIEGWLTELGNNIGYNICNYSPAINKRGLGLVKGLLTTIKQQASRAKKEAPSSRAAHLMEVADVSVSLSYEAILLHKKQIEDDRVVSEKFMSLQALVLADKKVDLEELRILRLASYLPGGEYLSPLASSPIAFLEKGFVVPEERFGRITIPPHRKGVTLFANHGSDKLIGDDNASGYVRIRPGDKRLDNRNNQARCYTLSLSTNSNWKLPRDQNPLPIIEKEFRIIDPSKERVKKDDVVVYIASLEEETRVRGFFESIYDPHMGFVSKVPLRGQPIRVISKFGSSDKIYEHDIDQAPLRYGHAYFIARRH